jgi:uncharacterized MnhB-related membrane protein
MKNLIYTLFIAIICLNSITASASTKSKNETVILSSKDDSYYSLAEEISEKEGIPIYQTFEEVGESHPVFLLWVIAPDKLSETVLMDFSNQLKQLDTSISVGIISGKTIKDARNLWKGASQIQTNDFAIINGTKKNKIEPEIIARDDDQLQNMELTMKNILTVLQDADAVQISLEGAAGLWFDKSLGIAVRPADIPELGANIIQNYGCSTFRPWEENSIALECIEKGAVAYCGFVYSSIAGTRFGDYTDISTIYTWNKFPMGHLVQIQNHAAMQSYADAPHYFIMGDPRIYCKNGAPYEIKSDEVSGNIRTIQLTNVKPGLIPIYIEDGAGYEFVSIPGLTSSAMDSSSFNSRLQMIDINADKYIVIDNDNDVVTIELHRKALFIQRISSYIVGFLDSSFTQNQGSSMPILIALPLLILYSVGIIRKCYTRRQHTAALAFGSTAALISLLYILMRSSHVIITNIPVKVNWFYIFSIFVSTGYGELLYVRASKLKGKIIAVLAANLNTLATFIIFVCAHLIKLILFGNTFSINQPGYPWLSSLKELIVGGIIVFAAYYLFNKLPMFRTSVRPVSEVNSI